MEKRIYYVPPKPPPQPIRRGYAYRCPCGKNVKGSYLVKPAEFVQANVLGVPYDPARTRCPRCGKSEEEARGQ